MNMFVSSPISNRKTFQKLILSGGNVVPPERKYHLKAKTVKASHLKMNILGGGRGGRFRGVRRRLLFTSVLIGMGREKKKVNEVSESESEGEDRSGETQ